MSKPMSDIGTDRVAVRAKSPFHVASDDALGNGDAIDVATRIRRGEVSAEEVLLAARQRLLTANDTLHALAAERYQQAQQEALEQGDSNNIFAGVPTLLKDNTDIIGLPTRHGSAAVAGDKKAADGVFTKLLESTGAIIAAKSRLPEFGLTCTTEHSSTGPCRNPWNTEFSTGGSSGGSAAMVAAGAVPFAHANDGGGSIRIPAACCGLVGLKPTRDRLPQHEMVKGLPINIVADGIVSRSVRDTLHFMQAADTYCQNTSLPSLEGIHPDQRPEKSLRIGYFTDTPSGSPADPECVAAVEATAALCESLGHKVEPIAAPASQQMADDFLLYWAMLGFSLDRFGRLVIGKGFQSKKLDPITQQLGKHFARNAYKAPLAIRRLKSYEKDYNQLFENYDLILTPTLAKPPVEIGYLATDLPWELAHERLVQYACFTPAQNISGAPAITLPLATSSKGLPIGLQFAAKSGEEKLLLRLALQLEEAQPWKQVWEK